MRLQVHGYLLREEGTNRREMGRSDARFNAKSNDTYLVTSLNLAVFGQHWSLRAISKHWLSLYAKSKIDLLNYDFKLGMKQLKLIIPV